MAQLQLTVAVPFPSGLKQGLTNFTPDTGFSHFSDAIEESVCSPSSRVPGHRERKAGRIHVSLNLLSCFNPLKIRKRKGPALWLDVYFPPEDQLGSPGVLPLVKRARGSAQYSRGLNAFTSAAPGRLLRASSPTAGPLSGLPYGSAVSPRPPSAPLSSLGFLGGRRAALLGGRGPGPLTHTVLLKELAQPGVEAGVLFS